VIVRQLLLGPLQNFVYILGDPDTRQALVVDPGWDMKAIQAQLAQDDLKLTGLLVTHTHFDHINAVPPLVKAADVPVYVHKAEVGDLPLKPSSIRGIDPSSEIPLGSHRIQILHTPGHTPGSICFLIDDRLLTGDTLFVKACGRSDLPGGDPEQLYRSLDRIAKLDGAIAVHPGHDYGDTTTSTIGKEKQQNPFMQFRSPQEFVSHVRGG